MGHEKVMFLFHALYYDHNLLFTSSLGQSNEQVGKT